MALVVGFLATVLAAVLPARRASRLPIVDALRYNV
jgi:putative ABC transport system permease protein